MSILFDSCMLQVRSASGLQELNQFVYFCTIFSSLVNLLVSFGIIYRMVHEYTHTQSCTLKTRITFFHSHKYQLFCVYFEGKNENVDTQKRKLLTCLTCVCITNSSFLYFIKKKQKTLTLKLK